MDADAILDQGNAEESPLLNAVPEEIRDEVRKYVARAESDGLSIDPNRMVICACLLVTAERKPECYLPRGRTVSTAPTNTLGSWWFGLNWDWESDPANYDEEVKSRYATARKAMQEIYESAKKARRGIKGLMALLDKHDKSMPEPFRHFRDDLHTGLAEWEKISGDLIDVMCPQEDAMKRRREKLPHERFDVPQQAFVWWRYCFGSTRAYWQDLHALARAWRLTDCSDVQEFKRVVIRLTERGAEFETPPDWCRKLCHSL